MSTVIVVVALLFVVAMIYAISIQDDENTSNGCDKFVSVTETDTEDGEENPLIVNNFRKLKYDRHSLFEYLGEFYVLEICTYEYSKYTTKYKLIRISDNVVLGSINTYDCNNDFWSFTNVTDNFKEVYSNMIEINIIDILNDKVSNLNPLQYSGLGDTLYLELVKDCLYLQVFINDYSIGYINHYYNLLDLSEELSLVKLYKTLCSVSSISVCEDPRKTYWKVFLEHEYKLKKIEDGELKTWVDSVIDKHQEYNDLQYKYETIPAAPIDDISGFINFCKIVHEDVKFEEYKIQNYLTQVVNERKLQMGSGK